MDMEALQATELDELQKKHRFDKDAVIQRCMKLTQSTSNTELYVKYQAEKKSKLAKLDEEYGQREHEIRQRYQESNSLPVLHDRHMSETLDPPSSPSEKSEDDEESELHRVPSYTPKVEAEGREAHLKKRKLSQDKSGGRSDALKRPQVGRGLFPNVESVTTLSGIPAAPSAAPSAPSSSGKRVITYQEVRRRATEEGHWDTIVAFPAHSNRYYILFCTEHWMHFRTDAVRAAAKHLNSIAHEFPNRNFQPTVEALGYRITDCTYALKETHNEEVLLAFKNGYVPQNKQRHQGERVKYPFGKTNVGVATTTEEAPALLTSQITTMSRARVKAAQPSNPIVDFDTPRRSKSRMLHKEPKAFYLYNCHYSEEVDGEETDGIWPVLVLGWHDLRPGNAPIDRLGDTPLLANNSDPPPPRCYIYEGSNKKDRITGWATGYENGGRNYKKRKYPVMFFDDYESAGRKNSYAWMSCDDLERFPIERKEAPKTRGYKPRAFNIARAFIAEREGFGSWAERETARLEGRLALWRPVPQNSSPKLSCEVRGDGDHVSSKDDISESGSVSNSTSVIDIYHRLLRPTRGLTSLSPGPSNGDPDATNAMNDRASSTPIIAEPAKQKFTAKRTTWPKARSSALPNVMNQVHDVTATDSRPIATTSTTTPTTAITTTAAPTTATSAVDAGADPRLVVRAPAPPPIPTTTPPILPRSALATESAEILDGPHDFELVSYNDAAIGITWNRAKSDDPGMKLYKRNSGKLLCPVERSDEIGIDPSIWDRIHLQSTVDNSIITVSTMADPDQKITMMFGRRPGDDTVAAGKMQARQFISWLRKQREAIGMQLLVGSG